MLLVVAVPFVLGMIAPRAFGVRAACAEPIALVSDDAAMHTALVDAGDVVTVDVEKPPAVGELAAASRAIADRLNASVTVWLIPSGTSSTSLVTYDRGSDRVIVRDLPYALPLDAARATEAARIMRTMLRSMRTPDVGEGNGTQAASGGKASIGVAGGAGASGLVAPREPQFAFDLGGGVWVAAPGAIANPVVTATAAWRPHALGAAVQATFGPAAELEMSSFRGDVRDVVIAGLVRNALTLSSADLRIVPAAGAALHILHVAGDTLDSRRFDPALRVGMAVLRALPRDLEVGLDVSADCLLVRQKYQAGTEEILAVPRVQIVAAVVIGIRL